VAITLTERIGLRNHSIVQLLAFNAIFEPA